VPSVCLLALPVSFILPLSFYHEIMNKENRAVVAVRSWSAWCPGAPGKNYWLKQFTRKSEAFKGTQRTEKDSLVSATSLPFQVGETPKVSFLPLSLRKKLSPVTKASLFCACECLEGDATQSGNVPSVFASQHGEAQVTVELLNSIVAREPVSPVSFTRSVHNTASGIFSIAKGFTSPYTAIAAGEETFQMALLEAWLQLSAAGTGDKILVVMADEQLPEDFEPFVNQPRGAYAIASLLELVDKASVNFIDTESDSAPLPAFNFLRNIITAEQKQKTLCLSFEEGHDPLYGEF